VARGFYVRGTLNVEEGLARIEKSGAQAVVMIGTYDPCAKFIRLAREHDFHPIFYNVSFVGAEELARRLGRASDEIVLMSQVVPPPYGEAADALKGSSVDYLEHLAQYYPDETPNVVGLEGYLNARVLVEGLERAGRDLTRARFISAIESIRDLPIGGGGSIKFSPSDHQGLERVYFTRLEADRFELIKDWKGIGTEHSSRPPAAGPVEARP
jgi:ABC-type branched-subunit amino acid transport system substrate-binding protein